MLMQAAEPHPTSGPVGISESNYRHSPFTKMVTEGAAGTMGKCFLDAFSASHSSKNRLRTTV